MNDPDKDSTKPTKVGTHGVDPDYKGGGAPKGIDPETGMHKSYWVLSEEERAKGFVRPLRYAYKHIGIRPTRLTRPLTDEEHARHGTVAGYVAFEAYPEDSAQVGRFWTQEQLDSGCGVETRMSSAISETYARDPSFYGSTFCTGCKKHFPLEQFTWMQQDGAPSDEVVGS